MRVFLFGLAAFCCCCAAARAQELADPIRLMAGGKLVDTEIGHAAPYLADIDRDGNRDLLVGQFGGGKLKIHRNIGSNQNPDYEAPKFLEANGQIVSVPTG